MSRTTLRSVWLGACCLVLWSLLLGGVARAGDPAPHEGPDGFIEGVGWRVEGGVFRDAAHGIEWAPPAGWRLAVGAELRRMNDSACVGLVCSDPEVFVVVHSEAAHGADAKALLAALRASVEQAGARVGAPTPLDVGGRSFDMQPYLQSSPAPIRLHHGARMDAGRAVQVQWWCLEGREERARPRVKQACAALRFLDAPARAALAAQLGARRDPQEQVGPTFALRSGRYVDFEHGFTWTKPPGFWVAGAGERSRAQNEDATLYIEDSSVGLYGFVIAQTIEDMTPETLHHLLVESLEPEDAVPEPTKLALGGVQALSTELRSMLDGHPMRHVATSVLHGGRAYQLLLWGLEGNVQAARGRLDAALHGFAFPPGLSASERTADGAHVDHRLGFRLRKPAGEGWRFLEQTPTDLRPMGSCVAFTRGESGVQAGGVCALAEEHDPRRLADSIIKSLRQRAGVEEAQAVETPATFAGLPARRIDLGGRQPFVMWLIHRGRSVYFVAVGPKGAEGLPADDPSALFELLD